MLGINERFISTCVYGTSSSCKNHALPWINWLILNPDIGFFLHKFTFSHLADVSFQRALEPKQSFNWSSCGTLAHSEEGRFVCFSGSYMTHKSPQQSMF